MFLPCPAKLENYTILKIEIVKTFANGDNTQYCANLKQIGTIPQHPGLVTIDQKNHQESY
jgi:hypothetical protein